MADGYRGRPGGRVPDLGGAIMTSPTPSKRAPSVCRDPISRELMVDGLTVAEHREARVAAEAAGAYFTGQDLNGRRALLDRARRGEAITIPTTQHGDFTLAGAEFLRAVDHV